MTGPTVVRLVDTGTWLFAVFDDGTVHAAPLSGAPFVVRPVDQWTPTPHTQVFIHGAGSIVDETGRYTVLGKPNPSGVFGVGHGSIDLADRIVSIASSARHVFTVEADGRCQAWSKETGSANGDVGVGDVVAVAADTTEVVLLDRFGVAWTQTVTIPDIDPFAWVPARVPAGFGEVALAFRSAVARDSEGDVWWWETSGAPELRKPPAKIPVPTQFSQVAVAGKAIIWALDHDGRLWDGVHRTDHLLPSDDLDAPIVAVTASDLWRVWALDVDGHVWFKGRWPGGMRGPNANEWIRLGMFGSDRFSLLTQLLNSGSTDDPAGALVSVADRIAP